MSANGPDRDLAAELVGDHREHARDRLAAGGPGGGVGRVGVHDAADVRHVPVDVGVRGGVRRRRVLALDQVAVEVATRPWRRRQVVVGHPDGLITSRSLPGHPGRRRCRRSRRPGRSGQLGVQRGHLGAQLARRCRATASDDRRSCAVIASGLPRRIALRRRIRRWRRGRSGRAARGTPRTARRRPRRSRRSGVRRRLLAAAHRLGRGRHVGVGAGGDRGVDRRAERRALGRSRSTDSGRRVTSA